MQHSAGTPRGCARWAERYRPRHGQDAAVELRLGDGSCWRLDLLDISAGGVSFGLEPGQHDLVSGMRIDEAVVCIGKSRIAGSLVIVHVTEEFSVGTFCGASFAPATEADRTALDAVMGELGGNRPGEP